MPTNITSFVSSAVRGITGPTGPGGNDSVRITNVQITDSSYNVVSDTVVRATSGGYIKITGVGFVSGCVVSVGSPGAGNLAATSTTFVSSTELRSQMPATKAGAYNIYVTNPNGVCAIRPAGLTYTSSPTATTVTTAPISIGDYYQGGYYAGKVNVSSTIYYLLIAPKSTEVVRQIKQPNVVPVIGSNSDIDGAANTAALNSADYPATFYCSNLEVEGYSDWYLPSAKEWATIYYFLKPHTGENVTNTGATEYAVSPQPVSTNYTTSDPAQTTALAFRSPGQWLESNGTTQYWTSTGGTGDNADIYIKSIVDGSLTATSSVATKHYVRAIRKVAA